MDPLTQITTRATAPSERARGEQVKNHAGGYVFAASDEARLRRFLVLGTAGGTYYASPDAHTKENATFLLDLIGRDPDLVLDVLSKVNAADRAPKHDTLLFALAAVAGLAPTEQRQCALGMLSDVARTGTHLFTFATYAEQFRGWGRTLRRGIGQWYTSKTPEDLAYQGLKYRQRGGWSHRDLLRLAHPVAVGPVQNAVLRYLAKGHDVDALTPDAPALIDAFEQVRSGEQPAVWGVNHGLTWEMLPTSALKDREVWVALASKMPLTALIRNLPRMTGLGCFEDTVFTREISMRLTDGIALQRAHVHPYQVLLAQRTYAEGVSFRGSATWTPKRTIVDALDAAYYAAFGAVTPAGKRTLVALDVSGSMDQRLLDGPLTAREGSTALALITLATEPSADVVAFTSGGWSSGAKQGYWNAGITPLALSPRQRLDDALSVTRGLPFGGTDCALPMLYAAAKGLSYDTFVVLTDNETWAGDIQPFQALQRYREKSGIDARLAVVAMTSTGFSIADPTDPGMLDVVGFDAAGPGLVADFSAGRI